MTSEKHSAALKAAQEANARAIVGQIVEGIAARFGVVPSVDDQLAWEGLISEALGAEKDRERERFNSDHARIGANLVRLSNEVSGSCGPDRPDNDPSDIPGLIILALSMDLSMLCDESDTLNPDISAAVALIGRAMRHLAVCRGGRESGND